MKRRSFLQALLAVVPLLPSKTLYADIDKTAEFAKEHNILQQEPKTVNELYSCINKLCKPHHKISKAKYEEYSSNKSILRWTHKTYAIAKKSANKDTEKELVAYMWRSIKEVIYRNKDEKPHILWRRVPEYSVEEGEGKVTMRLSIGPDGSADQSFKPFVEKLEGNSIAYLS